MCNFHEVKSLKAFLPLEKIVPHREQQQRSNVWYQICMKAQIKNIGTAVLRIDK